MQPFIVAKSFDFVQPIGTIAAKDFEVAANSDQLLLAVAIIAAAAPLAIISGVTLAAVAPGAATPVKTTPIVTPVVVTAAIATAVGIVVLFLATARMLVIIVRVLAFVIAVTPVGIAVSGHTSPQVNEVNNGIK